MVGYCNDKSKPMNDNAVALEIRDLHKQFGDLKVLKGISLEARQHNVVSILGSSGSGKSTLLRCVNLLETPSSGEVLVRGELIKMKPRKMAIRFHRTCVR